MKRHSLVTIVLLGAVFCLASAGLIRLAAAADEYDVVISGGRVMDPESKLDAVRNVGISGGKIRAITVKPLKGRTTLDAKGLVVSPGFIDLHEHGQAPDNYKFQAHDGVTTSLELEGGTDDVDKWYSEREGKSLINFGVSIGHIPVRARVMAKSEQAADVEASFHREATPEEIAKLCERIEKGLKQGALAEGMGIN